MLADLHIAIETGTLNPEIHLPGTAPYALLAFIADELPRWRAHPDRKPVTSEKALTDELCDHLSSAARISDGWSWIHFRTEIPDEVHLERAIDLAPKPCGVTVSIAGRRYKQNDMLLPIECKRLPTPKKKDRDEREYVVTANATRGGIQRFKFGFHGKAHCNAAMIAYVQKENFSYWQTKVNSWIRELSAEAGSEWSESDCIHVLKEDAAVGLCTLYSHHQRGTEFGEIELRHIWITMN